MVPLRDPLGAGRAHKRRPSRTGVR